MSLQSGSIKLHSRGSGCGSVGGVVVSDIRGPRFDCCHLQNLYWTLRAWPFIIALPIEKGTNIGTSIPLGYSYL